MNEEMYKFELTEGQVNLLLSGLAKLPLEFSFDLFSALRGAVIQRQESKAANISKARPMGELFEEEENKIGMTD